MIYFGDGLTDVPIMILTKNNGGTAIAVYSNPNDKEKVENLLDENRVNFVCKADYSENKDLEKIVQLTIDSIAIQQEFSDKYNTNLQKKSV